MQRSLFPCAGSLLAVFLLGTMEVLGQVSGQGWFVENHGQWPAEARFLATLGSLNAWVTDSGIVYDFYQMRALPGSDTARPPTFARHGDVVRMRFAGGGGAAHGTESRRLPGYHNYFIGSDTARWAHHVPLFAEARIDHLYSGIDARLTLEGNGLRYDLLVAPGADPAQVRLEFEGAREVWVDSERGELVIETSKGEVRQGSLLAYQEIGGERRQVRCAFEQRADGSVGFALGRYDRSLPLVVDPLIWSTYLPSFEMATYSNTSGFAVDPSGRAVVLSITGFPTYPTTPGAYDRSYQPGHDNIQDLVVTKLASDARSVVFATYIGGETREYAQSIKIGEDGAIYIGGYTHSGDYPTTPGAFRRQMDSSYGTIYGDSIYPHASAFVTKLAEDGSALDWSTFIGPCLKEGGIYYDSGPDIVVNGAGEVYMTGQTIGRFPTTPGVLQSVQNFPHYDAFVCKLNRTGSDLLFSTCLGGASLDYGARIALDSEGNIIVLGGTCSVDFPTTPGAFDRTVGTTKPAPPYDFFVAKLDPNATRLIFSTLIGGDEEEAGAWYGLALDPQGTIYISGETESPDFPVTPGAYKTVFDTTHTPESFDPRTVPFVLALDASGTLRYSTFVDNPAHSLVALPSGALWMSGGTNKPTPDAYDTSRNGDREGTISLFNPLGNRFLYSTYIGGTGADWVDGIVVRGDTVYGVSRTYSEDFPVTPGVVFPAATFPLHQPAFFAELAVFKLLVEQQRCTFPMIAGPDTTVCARQPVSLSALASGGTSPYVFLWRDEDGGAIRSDSVVMPERTTRYIVVAHDAAGCTSDPDTITVTVLPPPTADFSVPPGSCLNTPVGVTVNSVSGGADTRFQIVVNGLAETPALVPGATAFPFVYSYTPPGLGDYTIRLAVWNVVTGCSDTIQAVLQVSAPPVPSLVAVGDSVICEGDTVFLSTREVYASYRWSTGETTRQIAVHDAGDYYVEVRDSNDCAGMSDTFTLVLAPLPPGPSMTRRGDTLYSSPATSYQWYRNGQLLASETRQWILPSRSGEYSVRVTNDAGCGRMSTAIGAGVRRVVWLDTVSARVGERVMLRMRVHPPLEESDSVRGYSARLTINPAALFFHNAYAPDDATAGDPRLSRLDMGATLEVQRDSATVLVADSTMFQLELEGLISGQPINVVEIESVITSSGDTLGVLGNGLVLLEGCGIGRQFGKRARLVAVMPNPAAGSDPLRVRWRAPVGSAPQLRIVDPEGAELWSTELFVESDEEQESVLSLKLPGGVYLIQMIEGGETTAVPWIIKW